MPVCTCEKDKSADAKLVKARFEANCLDVARAAAGLIGELAAPEAVAVTVFSSAAGFSIEAYYPTQADLTPLKLLLVDLHHLGLSSLTTEAVPDINWVVVSQTALPMVVAGRFYIHGSHDRRLAHGRLDAIEIDAGEAFGTAHHATTAGCLIAISEIARTRKLRRVLDLGCGSGVLAIAAARAWPAARVWASDSDPRASAVARRNIRINKVARRVHLITAAGFTNPLFYAARPFDLIVANLLAEPLIQLAPVMRRYLATDAAAIISGLLASQAHSVRAAYVAAGFKLDKHRQLFGWSTLTLRRR
jgi:ribosomal protein L11 methyltransferase